MNIKSTNYIFGFSEGSVLVDYLVELNDVARQVDTQEIKKLFHESLDDALLTFGSANRAGKSLNETKLEGKLSLGNFVVDPDYTDFLGMVLKLFFEYICLWLSAVLCSWSVPELK